MTNSNTLSQDIAHSLREEILREQYRVGERLPSERDLAGRFNASRGAVREALSQIEQLGLIQIQPGGARVQPITAARIALLGPLMSLTAMPDPELVDQFMRTFAALTCLTVTEAIENASDEQLKQLSDMVVHLSRNTQDFETMQSLWREFLDQLAEIANNLVVRLIGNDLKAQFVEQMMASGIKAQPQASTLTALFKQLGLGIINRDTDMATRAMQTHFEEMRAGIGEALRLEPVSYQKEAG